MRSHQSLRVTPAMEAGIDKHHWIWEELSGWNAEQASASCQISGGHKIIINQTIS